MPTVSENNIVLSPDMSLKNVDNFFQETIPVENHLFTSKLFKLNNGASPGEFHAPPPIHLNNNLPQDSSHYPETIILNESGNVFKYIKKQGRYKITKFFSPVKFRMIGCNVPYIKTKKCLFKFQKKKFKMRYKKDIIKMKYQKNHKILVKIDKNKLIKHDCKTNLM